MSTDVTQPVPGPSEGDGGMWYACRVEGCQVRTSQRAIHRAWHDTIRDVYTCASCAALVREQDRAAHDVWDASIVRLRLQLGIKL